MTDPTVRWAKAIGLVIVLATGLSLSIVSRVDAGSTNCPNPGAFWCEDWEAVATNPDGTIQGYDGPSVSTSSLPRNIRILTGVSHSGTKSLEFFYPANVNSGPGYMFFHFSTAGLPAGTPELYMRWYQRWSDNWTLGTIGNQGAKSIVFYMTKAAYPQFYWEELFGHTALMVQAQVVKEVNFDSENFYQNIGTPVTFQGGNWYCIEAHLLLNTPGQANGALEAWIDGVLTLQARGREFLGTSSSDPAPSTAAIGQVLFSGSKNPQLTDQFTWYDDIVLSTQPIGCLGGSSLQAPSALTIK